MDNQRFEEIKQHYAGYGGLHDAAIGELIAEVERLQAVNEQSLEALELAYGTGPKTWYDRDNRIGSKIEQAVQAIRKAKGEVSPLPNPDGK